MRQSYVADHSIADTNSAPTQSNTPALTLPTSANFFHPPPFFIASFYLNGQKPNLLATA